MPAAEGCKGKAMNENYTLSRERKKNSPDRWRPEFHFTPPEGWMNDPNALIYYNEWYHLFYQYNPFDCNWGSMHWGHAVSKDMLHWKDCPIALYPDEPYDEHPEGGCFSGCAVEKDGMLYILYSSTVKKGSKVCQTQSLAFSRDGIHFEKYRNNPVIAAPPAGASEDFRDPKVFSANNQWYMVIGGSVGGADSISGDGRVFLYSSRDLYEWEFCGSILESNGKMGTMFECPDMFELNGKWILTCSPMKHPEYNKAMYCVGSMDFDTCTYTVEKIGSIDLGFDYYAMHSFLDSDGNRILIAWQNEWLWMPWCENWGPTETENWRGVLSLPRVASLTEDLTLCLKPIDGFNSLIKSRKTYRDYRISTEKRMLPLENPYSFQLEISLQVNNIISRSFSIGIWGKDNKVTLLTVDLIGKIITFDKNRSDNYIKGTVNCPVELADGKLDIRIICDHSVVEIYINGGYYCMTNNVYPEKDQTELWIATPYKTAVLDKLTVSSVESVWSGERKI
jgi:beta-fructofuranosidase